MPLRIFGSNSIGTGVRGDLANLDGAIVSDGVVVGSTDGIAIEGNGGGHVVDVQGSVYGADSAVVFNGFSNEGNYLRVGSSGEVKGFAFFLDAAVIFESHRNVIENQGTIWGFNEAVELAGSSAGSSSRLINSGTIESADREAIRHTGHEALIVTNTGLIKGGDGQEAFDGVSTRAETILNSGRIIGDIDFGHGNDVYDGRVGHLSRGVVQGNNGNDTLYGGVEGDTFFGGDGNDKLIGGIGSDSLNGGSNVDTLTGGAGADKLTGGLNADRFVFNAVVESRVSSGRDTILDFNRAQGDKIQLNAIDANVTAGGNQAFKFIGAAAFTGHAGELRTQKIGTDLHIFADTNGDKIADFSVISNVPVAFVKADFIL